jgi:hypothetical protein
LTPVFRRCDEPDRRPGDGDSGISERNQKPNAFEMSGAASVCYGEKAPQLITAYVINITKAIKAAKITSRLNLRIRLWYSVT